MALSLGVTAGVSTYVLGCCGTKGNIKRNIRMKWSGKRSSENKHMWSGLDKCVRSWIRHQWKMFEMFGRWNNFKCNDSVKPYSEEQNNRSDTGYEPVFEWLIAVKGGANICTIVGQTAHISPLRKCEHCVPEEYLNGPEVTGLRFCGALARLTCEKTMWAPSCSM